MNNRTSDREKIRQMFRLDRWWGRVIFFLLLYLTFWWVFYGIWLILPFKLFSEVVLLAKSSARYYIFGIVPFLSLYVPYRIRTYIKIKWYYMYPMHLVFLIISIFIFFILALMEIYKNYQFIPYF